MTIRYGSRRSARWYGSLIVLSIIMLSWMGYWWVHVDDLPRYAQWQVPNGIAALAFSPDNRLLATSSADRNVIQLWTLQHGMLLRELAVPHARDHPNYSSRILAFSPDSHYLAADVPPGIAIWDVTDGLLVQTLAMSRRGISDFRFHADGQTLFVLDTMAQLHSWDTRTGQRLHTRVPPQTLCAAVCAYLSVSVDGRQVAAIQADSTVRVWDSQAGAAVRTLEGTALHGIKPTWSPDGQRLAISTYSCETCGRDRITVWRMTDGMIDHHLTGYFFPNIVFSPDESLIAASRYTIEDIPLLSRPGNVRVWNSRSGRLVARFWGTPDSQSVLAFSNDGRLLAVGAVSGDMSIWDMAAYYP